MKKVLLVTISIVLAGVIVFLALPSSYYIRKALVHWYPKIDQYTLFENRAVRAGDPQPWPMAQQYGFGEIDEEYMPVFDELRTVAFVVIKDDSLLFERYWDGYGPNSYSNSFSMAKSIVSLMIGAAIDEGLIEGVDQPVSDFLPQYGDFGAVRLTIEHLLTMSAGVEWDESYSGLFSKTTEAYYGRDLEGLMRRVVQIEQPGVKFNYQSGVTQLLAMVLEKATGKTISEYASEKLWMPMGAEHDALWSLDKKDGHEKAYCCFNSNARDFARFGQLMLNDGSWGDRQVVSNNYMENAVAPAAWLLDEEIKGPNEGYGYQFWTLEKEGMKVDYMRGVNGQYVFAIKDLDAVIVRLGHKRSKERTAANYPVDIDTWLDAGLQIIRQ